MPFGEQLVPAESADSAQWIRRSCNGDPATIASLLPNHFDAFIRVWPPDRRSDAWLEKYRDMFSTVASVAQRYTTTPERAWYAIWEGHGYTNTEQLHCRSSGDKVPSFELPNRRYYLMRGPIEAINSVQYPDEDGWRNPDLVWPDDHQWFMSTDVDFWSLYIGGDADLITELSRTVPTPSEVIGLDYQFDIEV